MRMDNMPRLSWACCCAVGLSALPTGLALVGDRAITIAQYKTLYADLPKKLKSKKPGIEGHREQLQSFTSLATP